MNKLIVNSLSTVVIFSIYILYLVQNSVGASSFFFVTSFLWLLVALLRLSKISLVETLLSLLVLSVPVSFRSITGGAYADLPVSHFNLFLLLLVAVTFGSLFTKTSFYVRPTLFLVASSVFSFIVFVSISLLGSTQLIPALKQYINLLAVGFSVITALLLNQQKQNTYSQKLVGEYELTTVLTGIILAVQVVAATMGKEMGQIDHFGGGRTAYGAIFSDYSFLSLYLATGATLQLVKFTSLPTCRISLLLFPFLLGMSAVTSARTGAVACVLSMSFSLARHLFIKRNIRKPYIYAILVVFSISAAVIVLGSTRSDSLISGSGRFENYEVALKNLIQHPLTGTGLGVSTYNELFNIEIPHNLFLQYLTQSGVFSGLSLIVFIIMICVYASTTNRQIFEPFMTMMIGSMFIPDILNSRFFIVFLIIIITFRRVQPLKFEQRPFTHKITV